MNPTMEGTALRPMGRPAGRAVFGRCRWGSAWRSAGRRMTRREMLRGSLAVGGGVALVPMLAACGGDDSGAQLGPNEKVTIDYWQVGYWSAGVEPLVARFRQENPNITVKLRTYPEYTPIIEGLQSSLAAQEPPAMAHVGWPWLRYASASLPHPTIEEVAKDAGRPAGWLEKNFAPNILQLGRADGAVQGVPLIMGEPGLHYNRDLFREAGLDRAPESWDEMREYARRIVDRTDAVGLYVGEYEDFYNEQAMVESNGGRMLIESGGGFRTGVGEPDAVQALGYLADMVLKDKTAEHGEPEQGQQSFLSGRIAMFGTSTAAYSGLDKSASFGLGVAAFPRFAGKTPRLPIGGACNMIFAADPKQRAAALELARFMSTPEAFTTFVEKTSLLPGREELFDDPRYLKAFREKNPAAQVSARQFPYAAPFASWPGKNGLEALKVLRDARSQFLSGERTVAEAMGEAAGRIDELINS